MRKNIEDKIEEALRKEPSFRLSENFGYNVLQAIKAKEKRSQRTIYFWMIIGILFMCTSGAVIVTIFFPNLLSSFSAENQVNNLIPLAVVVGVLVVFIQYLDKKLVKDRLVIP